MASDGMRNLILEAVHRVVGRNGLANTTIDAIAAEAGISKGGVLHYFSNKKDLLIGMIDRYETRLLERRAQILAKLPDRRHSLFKATVIALLEALEQSRQGIPNFSALLDNEELRKHVGVMKKRIFKEVSAADPHPERLALVLLVIDGLWMDVRFKPAVIGKEVREAAVRELLAHIDSFDA